MFTYFHYFKLSGTQWIWFEKPMITFQYYKIQKKISINSYINWLFNNIIESYVIDCRKIRYNSSIKRRKNTNIFIITYSSIKYSVAVGYIIVAILHSYTSTCRTTRFFAVIKNKIPAIFYGNLRCMWYKTSFPPESPLNTYTSSTSASPYYLLYASWVSRKRCRVILTSYARVVIVH